MGKLIKKLFIFAAIIFFWYVLVTAFQVPSYLFPNPILVFSSFWENRIVIFDNALITLNEVVIGFLIANLISTSIALGIAFNKDLEEIIMPFAITLKTIPIIAITPLLVIWLGSGSCSKIATAALICFFPSLVNVLRGVKSLDRDLVELFKVYSANKIRLTTMLIIPSIMPYLFAALKVSISLAVVGALVGEFIGANRGLGFLILSNYYNLNTPYVFACIIVSSLIGIGFYYLIHLIEKNVITWTVSID